MATSLLPVSLWDLIGPFLPTSPCRPKGGRPRVSDRACLTGILFVLRSDIPWQMLPQERACGSGMTCWRRVRDWQQAGAWDPIHFALLDWLARHDQIDWSRVVVDNCSVRAVYGGDQTGPNPTDRAKRGSKRHLICDARGVPLAVRLPVPTGTTRQKPWRWWMRFPHRRADAADCGSGRTVCSGTADTWHRCRGLSARHIVPLLAAGRTTHGTGLGRFAGSWSARCVAQRVPSPPRSLRQASRHPRGVPLPRMRIDLLALVAKNLAGRLTTSLNGRG